MNQLPPIISDLALILLVAGVVTVIVRKLKQPLVLGYIVAGFLASPHMPYMPSVQDHSNIEVWSEIGVIFLMFVLGLEFSSQENRQYGHASRSGNVPHHALNDRRWGNDGATHGMEQFR